MTSEDRFGQLWTDYLEGEFDDAALAELREMLAKDETLERRAADLFQVHRLLGFVHQDNAATGEAFVQATVAGVPRGDAEFVRSIMDQLPAAPRKRTRFDRRMWAALVSGVLVGVITTSAAWVYAMARSTAGSAEVVLEDGFESGPPPAAAGVPTTGGNWSGDFCELVGQRALIQPAEGERMLRFLRADYENKPKPAGSYVGDLHRLIDLRPRRSELQDGSAVVQLSAAFNAEQFPAEEKYQCSLSLYALDAETATNGSTRQDNTLQVDSLAYTRGTRLALDRRSDTWQRLSAELRLPPNTDFLLLRIGLSHATAAQRRAAFPGHYLDDVRVAIARRAPLP